METKRGTNMKILKKGTTVLFECGSCDCEFVVGIHSAKTPDKGENYYVNCPLCGNECHANINGVNKTNIPKEK